MAPSYPNVCGISRSCSWRASQALGRPPLSLCIAVRSGDPCGRTATRVIDEQPLCDDHVLRLAVALQTGDDMLHLSSGMLSEAADAIEKAKAQEERDRRREASRERYEKRAQTWVAIGDDGIRVGISVDPVRRLYHHESLVIVFDGTAPHRVLRTYNGTWDIAGLYETIVNLRMDHACREYSAYHAEDLPGRTNATDVGQLRR